ncbi:MAG: hypothetical protein ACLGHG_04120 [Gammaproteobacteria bacterium]
MSRILARFSGQKDTPILFILLTSLVLAWATPAHATREADALADLYRVARLMDAAALDLNMLLGEEQSPAYKARLDETLEKLDTAQKASAASLAEAGIEAAKTAAIAENVGAFTRLARVNRDTTMKSGAPEPAVVDEMMQRRKAARDALDPIYREFEKRAGLIDSPLSEARALALLLQQMSASYVENASAAYSVQRQISTEASIDQMARDFGKRLSQLAARAKGDEATKRVRAIQSKWKFIERSVLNYQENTVPFLVDRYTQVIVGELMAVAELLQ